MITFLIGRILFGGFFFLSGLNHFKNYNGSVGYARMKGVPMPSVAVLGSGALILLGGVGVILGVATAWSLYAIVLFLVPVTLSMHRFWTIADPMQKMGEQINFMKNIALLGAALMLLSVPTPWVLSL